VVGTYTQISLIFLKKSVDFLDYLMYNTNNEKENENDEYY
jgi:hypothetical protein